MEIQHLTLTAERESRLPLFPDEAAYREALCRLGAVAAGCLALFALIAEHLHLVVLLSRIDAGRFAQRTLLALRPIVATPLAPSYIKPVESRSHMRWLLRYILEQPGEHGMPGHPALWIGSCLPDLLGARIIDGLSPAISQALPEYNDAMALRIVGLGGHALPPADDETLRRAGAVELGSAVAATLGVDRSLAGNNPVARLGRRTLAQLARRVGIPSTEVAQALGRSPQTTWRLCQEEVEPRVLVAVARRVAFVELVQRVGGESHERQR